MITILQPFLRDILEILTEKMYVTLILSVSYNVLIIFRCRILKKYLFMQKYLCNFALRNKKSDPFSQPFPRKGQGGGGAM